MQEDLPIVRTKRQLEFFPEIKVDLLVAVEIFIEFVDWSNTDNHWGESLPTRPIENVR